ncbi:MAG: 3-deoxy-D-manno-octulosonic acid transferase, partial [Betaproteobacteria bacterium]
MEFARALYTLAGSALLPLLPLRLWWRGRREPGYRGDWAERFGHYRAAPPARGVWWVHAVSVGETRAALPLVQHLHRAYPEFAIVLTHMTATGREAGRALYGDTVTQAWLPYDLPFAVDAFLAHFRPVAGFLLETELWPNLIARAAARQVPVYLVNARLSERSAAGYRRFAALTSPMLARLAGVAAQSAADEARLTALGAPATVVTGNLKFDVTVPAAARELGAQFALRFGAVRAVWVAASTREGEEALLLDALDRTPLPPDTLLVIVPRHPQRFAEVANLLRERDVRFVRRSDNLVVPADARVVLGDSMGELFAYYAAADLAFVGGSLLPLGGQNLIEPLALGTPVLIGPHTFNFAEASAGAVA